MLEISLCQQMTAGNLPLALFYRLTEQEPCQRILYLQVWTRRSPDRHDPVFGSCLIQVLAKLPTMWLRFRS